MRGNMGEPKITGFDSIRKRKKKHKKLGQESILLTLATTRSEGLTGGLQRLKPGLREMTFGAPNEKH